MSPSHPFRARPRNLAALPLLALSACALGHPTAPVPLRLPAGVADTVRTERVAEGARLHTLVNTSAPWRAYVLEVDTRCTAARALKGGATAVGRTTTSTLLGGLPAEARAIAAVNADFFSLANGAPTNLHVERGVLLSGPAPKPVFTSDGRHYALDSVRVAGTIAGGGAQLALDAWNRPAPGRTGLVDASWGAPFDSLMRRVPVQRLEPLAPSPRTGPSLVGSYIVRAPTSADTLARGDTLLLHLAPGATPLPAGTTVAVSVVLVSAGSAAIREAVGGRPLLVVDSAVAADVDTEGNAGFRGLNPRSAVGMNRAGTRLWFAVIDGRRQGYSMGMTLRQTAELMRALGATRALNLDGGGSSALALRDPATGQVRVVNRPSDPVERPVGNAIAIQETCGR